jgi:hypothetical protein
VTADEHGSVGTTGTPRVTLIGKPGCHLCDDARSVIAQVCAETGDGWQELSIEDDPELSDAYWERIPVVLVDGHPHDFWGVDPARLRTALASATNR